MEKHLEKQGIFHHQPIRSHYRHDLHHADHIMGQDELNWDQFHPGHRDIYQLMVNRDFNGEVTTDKSVPFPLAGELKRNFPQVKNATIDNYGSDIILKYNETIIKQRALNVSQEYNDVFQWKFVKGSLARALANPEVIKLTATT